MAKDSYPGEVTLDDVAEAKEQDEIANRTEFKEAFTRLIHKHKMKAFFVCAIDSEGESIRGHAVLRCDNDFDNLRGLMAATVKLQYGLNKLDDSMHAPSVHVISIPLTGLEKHYHCSNVQCLNNEGYESSDDNCSECGSSVKECGNDDHESN